MSAVVSIAAGLDAVYAQLGHAATYYPCAADTRPLLALLHHEPAGKDFGPIGLSTGAWRAKVRAADLPDEGPRRGDKIEFPAHGGLPAAGRFAVTDTQRDARGLQWTLSLKRD